MHIVKEMFFTAQPITAQRAFDLGLVNHLVADEGAMSELSWQLASRICERAPLTIRAAKAEMHAITLPNHTGEQSQELARLRAEAWRSEDYREGITAFIERREPRFEGK